MVDSVDNSENVTEKKVEVLANQDSGLVDSS